VVPLFSVGDRVRCRDDSEVYTVTAVTDDPTRINLEGYHGYWYLPSIFTLVTPAAPVKPKLTGMAQFLKDTEGKYDT